MVTELLHSELTYEIIGAAMEVHATLGPGFLESVYQEAFAIELLSRKISFDTEKRIDIFYKGVKLEKHFVADFICDNHVIVEIKALSALTNEHQAQVLNYLKATGIKVGLLINFGSNSLEHKRLIW
ncbi:MAG TPA: GxxExxY protein [Bacteroidales bacterium]|jgi:GxxExxY protein|nr:GxxExxY protein [Bacteroidales bacterium]